MEDEAAADYHARLNIEGERKVWLGNRPKIEKVRILVIPERIVEEYEKKEIDAKIKLVMGQDCQVLWDFVDEIPKTPQRKYLYTKSLVRRPKS